MIKQIIRFGVIGCGLMGREFASAAARWFHLPELTFEPQIVAACDPNVDALDWFQHNVKTIEYTTEDYKVMIADPDIDAIYCAVPHHLHEEIYLDIIRSGKHLLGEKPFGIDLEANRNIVEEARKHPNLIIRCTSEFPFLPGAYRIAEWMKAGRFGQIIEVEAGLWHSSDLDPNKQMNWKRRVATNGEYGCMGDLGMHVLHLPLHFDWQINNVRSILTQVIDQRPDDQGIMQQSETWDNAVMLCSASGADGRSFPLTLSTKRIAPGHANTWYIKILGTKFSAEYSTKNPKQLRYLDYEEGKEQAWRELDLPHQSAYSSVTGSIFEFGFSDALLQMWASFCDEVANGAFTDSRIKSMDIDQTYEAHRLFTAALQSQHKQSLVGLMRDEVTSI